MKLVLLMGTSGSGKNFNQRMLIKHKFKNILSATTRQPRAGEIEGTDYLFLSHTEFINTTMIEKEEFSGNHYGTPDSQFKNNDLFVKIIEPYGAVKLIKYAEKENIDILPLFFNLPVNQIIKNMKKRGDSDQAIFNRLSQDDIFERFVSSGIDCKIISKMNFNIIEFLKDKSWI